MFRKIAISALGAAALLAASMPAALAMPRGNGLPVVNTELVQLIGQRKFRGNGNRYYRHGNYRHGIYGHRNYRRGYYGGYYGGYYNGAAVVAGIIGLGTLLAIASSNRRYADYDDGYYGNGYRSGSAEWIAACARKYRSFEPNTGLYTTYSGYKRRCRLP